jgi:DNA invertase Pin-like site-specific DNA recombinase
MDRVRDHVAAGGVSVMLAQDRDHFAREFVYHYLLRKEFEEHGTKIRALNDKGDDSPEGELTDGILDQLAKYERAKIAERTRRGIMRMAREGRVIVTRPDEAGLRIPLQRSEERLGRLPTGDGGRWRKSSRWRQTGSARTRYRPACSEKECPRPPAPATGKDA